MDWPEVETLGWPQVNLIRLVQLTGPAGVCTGRYQIGEGQKGFVNRRLRTSHHTLSGFRFAVLSLVGRYPSNAHFAATRVGRAELSTVGHETINQSPKLTLTERTSIVKVLEGPIHTSRILPLYNSRYRSCEGPQAIR